MKWFALSALIGAGLLAAGCEKASTPPVSAPAPASDSFVLTAPQGKLRTIKLWLGPEELETEVALSPMEQATGMMFRTNLPENCGMIFIRPEPEQASFWMTNCPLPLGAAYIAPDGTILEIHELKSNDPTPVVSTSDNIQYVLEVNSKWFDRHNIRTGTLITTEHGSLPDVFLRRR